MPVIANTPAAPRLVAIGLGACLALGFATAASAQNPAAPVYAVTYLDVSSDWIVQGTGLIKQYRDASRREAGNLEFTVLQETARPNRFAIVEGWKDQQSIEAHAKSADTKRFDFVLEAIRNSPPNQHVLETFATAAARPAAAGAVYMVQHIDIAFPEFGPPIEAAIKSLAEPSEKEPGALRYDIYQEPAPHANHFSVVAIWGNEKAYETHEAAPYVKKFRDAAALTGPGNLYDQRLYKVVE